jgi:hypothetical protein
MDYGVVYLYTVIFGIQYAGFILNKGIELRIELSDNHHTCELSQGSLDVFPLSLAQETCWGMMSM